MSGLKVSKSIQALGWALSRFKVNPNVAIPNRWFGAV